MAATKRFRTALNGFNREDVVNYIEYLNNQHNSQVDALNNQLREAQVQSSEQPDPSELEVRLEAALQRCQELEAQLASQQPPVSEIPAVPVVSGTASEELEAYRRAERAERLAQERAQQIYDQANAALADAAAKAETAAAHIGNVADQALSQLKECQDCVASTKASFQDAVASLYAIKPDNSEE